MEKKISDRPARLSQESWLGWLIIIGSLPVGIVGLLFKKQIEGTLTKNLWLIATMMVVVALFLLLAEAVGKRTRKMEDLGIRDALAVGGAQVLALIPGSSRSGSTIMGGLFAGETRETAARFSFLLSIPAIAASGLLELKEAIKYLPRESYPALAIATIAAFRVCGANPSSKGAFICSSVPKPGLFEKRQHPVAEEFQVGREIKEA